MPQTRTYARNLIDQSIHKGTVHTLAYYIQSERPSSLREEGLRFGGTLFPPGLLPVIPLLTEWQDQDPQDKHETRIRVEAAIEYASAFELLFKWHYLGSGVAFRAIITTRERLNEFPKPYYNVLQDTYDFVCAYCASVIQIPIFAQMKETCQYCKISTKDSLLCNDYNSINDAQQATSFI